MFELARKEMSKMGRDNCSGTATCAETLPDTTGNACILVVMSASVVFVMS